MGSRRPPSTKGPYAHLVLGVAAAGSRRSWPACARSGTSSRRSTRLRSARRTVEPPATDPSRRAGERLARAPAGAGGAPPSPRGRPRRPGAHGREHTVGIGLGERVARRGQEVVEVVVGGEDRLGLAHRAKLRRVLEAAASRVHSWSKASVSGRRRRWLVGGLVCGLRGVGLGGRRQAHGGHGADRVSPACSPEVSQEVSLWSVSWPLPEPPHPVWHGARSRRGCRLVHRSVPCLPIDGRSGTHPGHGNHDGDRRRGEGDGIGRHRSRRAVHTPPRCGAPVSVAGPPRRARASADRGVDRCAPSVALPRVRRRRLGTRPRQPGASVAAPTRRSCDCSSGPAVDRRPRPANRCRSRRRPRACTLGRDPSHSPSPASRGGRSSWRPSRRPRSATWPMRSGWIRPAGSRWQAKSSTGHGG